MNHCRSKTSSTAHGLMAWRGTIWVLVIALGRNIRRLSSELGNQSARGKGCAANVIVLLILAGIVEVGTNSCESRPRRGRQVNSIQSILAEAGVKNIRSNRDEIELGRGWLPRPALEIGRESRTTTHSKRRCNTRSAFERIGNESSVCNAIQLKRYKETPMEQPDEVRDHARDNKEPAMKKKDDEVRGHTTDNKEPAMEKRDDRVRDHNTTDNKETNMKKDQPITNVPGAPREGNRGGNAASTERSQAAGPHRGKLITESDSVTTGSRRPRLFDPALKEREPIRRERFDKWCLVEGGQTVVSVSNVERELLILRQCNMRHFTRFAMAIGGFWDHPRVYSVDGSVWIFREENFGASEAKCSDWGSSTGKSFDDLFWTGEELANVVLLPGTRQAWIDTNTNIEFKDRDRAEMSRLIDLDEGYVIRAVRGVGEGSLVVGTEPQKIFRGALREKSSIWSADGSSSMDLEETAGWVITDLTVGFSGGGYLASRRMSADVRRGVELAELVAFNASGSLQSRAELPEGEDVVQMLTLPGEGHTLVRTYVQGSGEGRLRWYRHQARQLVLEAVYSVPSALVVLQDQSSGSAAYVMPSEDGFRMGAIEPGRAVD